MTDWDPGAYDAFAAARQRPAGDLIHAIGALGAFAPQRITDLGCGSGLSTALLRERWPRADIVGLDRSPTMLAQARARVPDARFCEETIEDFAPEEAQDLLFANASLHWIASHASTFPRLFACLRPGGILAAQMPDNLAEPSHRLMQEVAGEEPFAGALAGLHGRRQPLLEPEAYYDLLAPRAKRVDIFTVHYRHALDGPEAIAGFFASTGLKPYLDPLEAGQRAAFLDRYKERLTQAYPRRRDNSVLLTLPRLFIIATHP